MESAANNAVERDHEANMTRTRVVITCYLGFFLFGCVDGDAQHHELASRLASTEAGLAASRKEIDALKEQLALLKQKVDWTDMTKDWKNIAYLTPGDEGYSTVAFDLGTLTVQLTDVKPYANGSKITLRIGNTLSSSIDGLKATIDWGRVNEKGTPDNASQKSKDMSFVQSIRGGAWTPLAVVLEGVPPEELGFVRISKVSHTGIQLLK